MRDPIPGSPRWIPRLERLYAVALWLYPRSHRERWGAPMRQAFRDRCREAAREGRGPWDVLFAELLPDLVTSVSRERLFALFTHRHEGRPMQKLISTLLVLVGACLFAVSAIALWNSHAVRTDMFDSLGQLQVAFGVAGIALTAMGLRKPSGSAGIQMQG